MLAHTSETKETSEHLVSILRTIRQHQQLSTAIIEHHSKMRQHPKSRILGDKYLVLEEIWPPIKEEEDKEQRRPRTLSKNTIIKRGDTKLGCALQHSKHERITRKRESRRDDTQNKRDSTEKRQGVQFKDFNLMYLYSPEEEFDEVIIVEK